MKLLKRECRYTFSHRNADGDTIRIGHTIDIPDHIEKDDKSVIKFIHAILTYQGYRYVNDIEIDVNEIYED